jgi:hypothetical protein
MMNGTKLEARAVLAEKLENFSLVSNALISSDVERIVDWIESDGFLRTCADAQVDPMAIQAQFNTMINRGFDNALSML